MSWMCVPKDLGNRLMNHFPWLYENPWKHELMTTLSSNFKLTGVESPSQRSNFLLREGSSENLRVPIKIGNIGANPWWVLSRWIQTSWPSGSLFKSFFCSPLRMTFDDLALRLPFLVQTGIGVLGNTFLLSTYILHPALAAHSGPYTWFSPTRLRPTSWFISSRGFPTWSWTTLGVNLSIISIGWPKAFLSVPLACWAMFRQ